MKRILSLGAILILALLSGCQLAAPKDSSAGPPPLATSMAPVNVAVTPTVTEQAPSGQEWIAFIKENNIWLIHPDGTGLTQGTTYPPLDKTETRRVGNLQWSPNGTSLVYAYGVYNQFGLYLFDVATFKSKLLVPASAGGFDWSATGKELIYDTPVHRNSFPWKNDGLWVYNFDKRTQKRIFQTASDQNGPREPHWSTDGRYVIASSPSEDPSDRVLADLAGGSSINLGDHIKGIDSCEWQPGEPVIACVAEVPAENNSSRPELVLMDVNGNPLNDLPLPDDWDYASLRWAPDGRRLALGYYDDASMGHTAIVSLSIKDIRPLASGAFSLWSSDGKWLLTWGERAGQTAPSQISVVNAASGKAYPLSKGDGVAWQPSRLSQVLQPNSVPTEPLTFSLVSTPAADIEIWVADTAKGDILRIKTKDFDYTLGPLEKGAYGIGPNRKFIVYCTNSGDVYAARLGDPMLHRIGDVSDFIVIRHNMPPRLWFEFFGHNPYTLQVDELIFNEKRDMPIPRYITEAD